jgi:hypothetical protein
VAVAELPLPVQSTLESLAKGATLSPAATANVMGETLFEVRIKREDSERRWTLDANGVPIYVSILPTEAPEPVRKAIQQLGPKAGTLVSILRSYEEGKIVYEAIFLVGRLRLVTTLDQDGAVTSREIPISEPPKKLVGRANAIAQGFQIEHCYFSEIDKEAAYTFSTAHANGPRSITLAADGELIEDEEIVAWDRLPETIQNAITQKLGTAEHVRAHQKKDDESTNYEIWAFNGGKLTIFWVSSEGVLSDTAP